MNLTGSRSTPIANVCALVIASVVIAEGAYIVHECLGYYRPHDSWGFFTPAIVMFIIRNRTFSYVFLTLYVALSVQMFDQARSIHVVPDACGGRFGGTLEFLPIFFFVSIVCLAIYGPIARRC